MKIIDALPREAIIPDLKATDKKGVIEELSAPLSKIARINFNELIHILLERERLGSTGVGGGIGIPHGKLKSLESLILGFGISQQGVDFESIDKKPVHIFFLLLTPENSIELHLKLLAKISMILKNNLFKKQLLKSTNCDEIFDRIKKEEEEKQ